VEFTVMFADLSGGLKLAEAAGKPAALRTLSHCLYRLKKAAQSCGGQVTKAHGTRLMALFSTVDAAANAAAKMHATINALDPVSGSKIGVQVAFHSGPVTQQGDDVVGDTVTLAAKLLEQATRGQTITTQGTAAQLSPALQPFSHQMRAMEVGGATAPLRLFEIRPPADAVAQLVTRVRLSFGEQTLACSRENERIVIGRDRGCGLVIGDVLASRRHCTVELRGELFVVQDHSRNGTYVTIEGERGVLLNGDSMRLRGQGRIGFGHLNFASSEVVEFLCS